MDIYIPRLIYVLGCYLIGSVPFGLITAKAMGAGDIRKMGSGNIGATNVLRSAGKFGGAITLLLDVLKGFIPLVVAKSWWGIGNWTLLMGFLAIVGHNYPIYLKFKGGKGVATSFGVLIALWPDIGLIILGLWIASVIIWRYSSLAALISFAVLPIIIIILGEGSLHYFIFSIIVSVMIFYRHKDNIKRLLKGEEKKIGKKGTTMLIILIFILFMGNSAAFAGNLDYAPALPEDIYKLMDARRATILTGDKVSADRLLENIISERYNHGMDRIDDVSALLVREGYQVLEKGNVEEALRLSNKAKEVSPSYAPSYYLASKSLFKKAEIMAALSEYLNGVTASLNDFWTLFNIAGRLYTVILIALTLTSVTILTVWLSRSLPILFHTFRELTTGFINKSLLPVFWGIIVIIPLIFGMGAFVLFWIVGSWLYLIRKERIIAISIAIFILILPQSLKYSSIYITGPENITLKGLLAVERGYGENSLIERLTDQYKSEPENKYLPLSIAYLKYKQGDYKGSLNYYMNVMKVSAGYINTMSLNNIGNAYFALGDYENAILYYKKAREDLPDSSIPVFNLSQVYREKLMFNDAEAAYEQAKKINPSDIGRYTTLATKGRGYRVIDFPIRKRDLWNASIAPTNDSNILAENILGGIIKIPAERFPFLGISIFIVLIILSYFKPRTPMAYHCPECGHIVCSNCTGSRIYGTACKECRRKDAAIDKVAELDRRISFFLPGIWHIYKGKVGLGGIVSLIFFIGVIGLMLGKIDDTWYSAYYLTGKYYIPWSLLILLPYLIIIFHLKFINIRIKN